VDTIASVHFGHHPLLPTLRPDGTDRTLTKGTPSTVIQVLKQRVSRRLRRKRRAPAGQLSLIFASGDNSQPRFWQRRFYDFNVWSLKKRVEKLHYMHMNPLKRKLVDHPKDWPWSSFSFYSNPNNGLIRVDPIR